MSGIVCVVERPVYLYTSPDMGMTGKSTGALFLTDLASSISGAFSVWGFILPASALWEAVYFYSTDSSSAVKRVNG